MARGAARRLSPPRAPPLLQGTLDFIDWVLRPALQLPTAIRPTREPDVLGQKTRGRAHPAAHRRVVPYPTRALPDSCAARAPNTWVLPYGPLSRRVHLDACHVSSPRVGADSPAPAYDSVLPPARYPPHAQAGGNGISQRPSRSTCVHSVASYPADIQGVPAGAERRMPGLLLGLLSP